MPFQCIPPDPQCLGSTSTKDWLTWQWPANTKSLNVHYSNPLGQTEDEGQQLKSDFGCCFVPKRSSCIFNIYCSPSHILISAQKGKVNMWHWKRFTGNWIVDSRGLWGSSLHRTTNVTTYPFPWKLPCHNLNRCKRRDLTQLKWHKNCTKHNRA